MLPNFLIIGAQKAGSTWLSHMLRQHPDVYVYEAGEIHFFNARFERGLEWYENHFAGWRGESAVGEKSPLYLSHPQAPSRIRDTLGPEVRLIMSLRHPVDRAYSAYWHGMKHGRVPTSSDFRSELAGDVRLMGISRYGDQVTRLLDHFPRENLLILIFEEVMSDRRTALADCFRFLEVEPEFSVTEPGRRVNQAKDVPILSRQMHVLRRAVRRLPRSFRDPAVQVGRGLFAALPSKREHVPLDPGVRHELTKGFEPDIRRLEAVLGRDLSIWSRDGEGVAQPEREDG